MKKFTKFRPRIKSRHPSHTPLRKNLSLLPFKSVVRLGSTTDMKDTISKGGARVECNTIDAITNSANKLLMKECFTRDNIPTALWFTATLNEDVYIFTNKNNNEVLNIDALPYPIVSKHIMGSRGRGNRLLENAEDLKTFLEGKNLNRYIFEKYYSYSREYRLHVTEDGCFYTCRKMLKNDTPQDQRWFRNDLNSVWILEDNESFDKPVNWENVVESSVNALKSVGLDVGAVDLRIQSSTNNKGEERDNPEFIVVEINSAPSFGDITLEKYLTVLPDILRKKFNNL